MTIKQCILFMLFCAAAFSQASADGTYPNNSWGVLPGANPYPDETISVQYCAYVIDSGGIAHPLPNVPYTFTTSTTPQSGFHTHEGVGSLPRPQAVFLGPTTGNVSANGCITIFIQLPAIAGWYTFTGSTPGIGTKGVNIYAKYYTTRHFGPKKVNVNLEPYPDNPAINTPQGIQVDTRHLSGGFSRYIDENTYSNFIGMSSWYAASTINDGIQDKLDIRRCSLPDGGISDNDKPQFAPGVTVGFEWKSRIFEEHARGTECDVMNPQTLSVTNAVLAIAAMQANSCIVGSYDPDGNHLSDPINYWLGQDKFHVTCALGRALKGTPRL